MNAPAYINNAHKALARNPGGLTLEELSGKLRVKAIKVSPQIRALHDAGLIETVEEAGQPVYKLKAAPAAESAENGRADIPPPQYDPASVAFPPSVVTRDPHTGTPRNPLDIESDPAGLLIVKDGEPMKAYQAEERILTPEAEAEREDFEAEYGLEGNCSCHLSAPCASCMHPGNPLQQDEDESCWMAAGDSEGGETDAPAVDAQREEFTLLGLIADIRAAAGDPSGRLMQDELVQHIAGVVKERDDLRERLDAQIKQWQADTGRLAADLRAAMESRSQAINEADRLRAELATERQAREALQEQSDAVDVKDAAVGYLVRVPKRAPILRRKPESARSAALSAVRSGAARAEVLAVVPVGTARRGAEWQPTEAGD